MDTFGEWLRQQRNFRRLTQGETAKRVGCSIVMLRKIENGERHPSIQIAELIANVFEIPPPERSTFVRVARGELSVDRLKRASDQIHQSDTSPLNNNLPILPTPLIGRTREIDELSRLLVEPQCHLLTLVGPGGIGKTRLAMETASQIKNEFSDGVYFIPFASVNSSRFIVPMIADAIGFSFQGESSVDPKSQLFNYLKEKQILLLLDNLEHLLGDSMATDLLSELLELAAKVKLLITSRESLDLQAEWIFEVRGLPVPDNEEAEGTSVELFLQRARRVQAGFNATTNDLPTILRICQMVDGMPLGIELAAGWMRVLSCEEIALELEHGLDFLHTSARDLAPRHRSMRAVFEHSWKLLDQEEQSILSRLSIFHGGFTREASEMVAHATISTLATLVTKSLIHRSDTGRYDYHELVRQYALEQLADQPKVQKDAMTRHARYFLKFLSKKDMSLRSSTQREALVQVMAEIDNIRGALEWALAHKKFDLIESSMRAYTTFFDNLGWAQEALEYLGRVKDVLEAKRSLSNTDQVALAHVLTSRSLFAYRTAQHELSHSMLNRSLEILRPLNEPLVLVETLAFLGIILLTTGDLAGSLQLFEEGLQIAKEIDDQWYAALCMTEIVGVNMFMGKVKDAHEQFQTVVDAWRRTGDLRFTAFGLNYLSLGAIAAGKYDEAKTALEESITINNVVGDRWGLGIAYRGLGSIAGIRGEHATAIEFFKKSVQIFANLGSRLDVARSLSAMGQSTFALGNDSEAEGLWRDSLYVAMETQGLLTAMEAIVGIAMLKAKEGNMELALELSLIVLSHPASLQETKTRASVLQAELEAHLTPAEIETIRTRAGEKVFDRVVDEILE